MPYPYHYRRKDPSLFWVIVAMACALVFLFWTFCQQASASPITETPIPSIATTEQGQTFTAEGIRKLLDRDYAPQDDPRRALANDIAKAIDDAAQATNGDAWLLTAMVFHESSFTLSACGKKNERGLLQVHGLALNRCRKKGLDPVSNLDQSAMCGALWLGETTEWCGGYVVRNWKKCKKTRTTPACDGGLSAYLSGKCVASTITGPRVAARLRTRDKLMKDTIPNIENTETPVPLSTAP
jgi:hypothetical protein